MREENPFISIMFAKDDQHDKKILLVGMGALGCEMAKNLILSGYSQLDLVDPDTIELSNLTRQLLFRPDNIGQSKAIVAAHALGHLQPSPVRITPHYCAVEELSLSYLKTFNLIICTVDRMVTRFWLNEVVCQQLKVPMVELGTTGWMGHVRLLLPEVIDLVKDMGACLYCWKDLYGVDLDETDNVFDIPLCTLAGHPTDIKHCIGWAISLEWPNHHPERDFNPQNAMDLEQLYEMVKRRAQEYSLDLEFEEFKEHLIHIVPNIISTTALVAGLGTLVASRLSIKDWNLIKGDGHNFWFINGQIGLNWSAHRLTRNQLCPVCK